MKLTFTSFVMVLFASAAAAHPGHLAEVAGHGHWIGAAAIGAAIALAAWAALKGKKADSSEVEEDAELDEEEMQEA